LFIPGVSPFATANVIIRRGSYTSVTAAPLIAPIQPPQSRDQLLLLQDQIGQIRKSLTLLERPLRYAASNLSYLPARFDSSEGLETGPARMASLQAVSEVNSTATSYSPFGPDWNSSTAEATISGVYDGSAGSGELRVEVVKGGTIDMTQVSIRIYNTDGSELRSFNLRPGIPAGTRVAIGNGLLIEFGEGKLVKNDSFTIDVFHDVGGRVDPNAAFDGVRNYQPNFDPGQSVTAGAFIINGVTIDVAADDTMLQVLDRITDSAAGVTASFDEASETVRLEQKTPGIDYGIELGADSSGFLAAVKLDGAVFEEGVGDEIGRPLDQIERFSGVSSGTLLVNDVALDIDITTDTVLDILERINNSGTGVTATLDHATGLISLSSNSGSRTLSLEDGGTGLFAALGVEATEFEPDRIRSTDGISAAVSLRTAHLIEDLAEALNIVFDNEETGNPGEFLTGLRDDIHQAVDRSFSGGRDRFRTDFGVNFDFRSSAKEVFRFRNSDRARFASALRRDAGPVRELFYGRGNSIGLSRRLDSTLRTAERELGRLLNSTGTLLDVTA